MKALDLSPLTIKKIIVHDIPKHKLNDYSLEPTYSSQESKLSDGLRLFFKQKVTDAFKSEKAIKVVFNPESPSPISFITNDLLSSDDPEFIHNSKSIAKHLYDVQGGNNSGGIMVIMYGVLETKPILVISKLERDNGVQLIIDPKTNTINLEEVQNLMMTQKTKIYKIALLFLQEDLAYDYDGIVTDYQIDLKTKTSVTTFFIDQFLGCKPYKDPKTTTQEFYRLTKSFINTIEDEVLKAKYHQDLNSYLQMNKQRLSGREFAEDYLSTKLKDQYKKFLKEKNFRFDGFIKDTTLISNRIEKISIEFQNGITILGKKGTFDDKVKLSKLENGKHKAEIVSKIKKIE